MSLDLEQLLPEVAGLLGLPLEEVAVAFRGEAATTTLASLEDVSALVDHSLRRLIGMEVDLP